MASTTATLSHLLFNSNPLPRLNPDKESQFLSRSSNFFSFNGYIRPGLRQHNKPIFLKLPSTHKRITFKARVQKGYSSGGEEVESLVSDATSQAAFSWSSVILRRFGQYGDTEVNKEAIKFMVAEPYLYYLIIVEVLRIINTPAAAAASSTSLKKKDKKN